MAYPPQQSCNHNIIIDKRGMELLLHGTPAFPIAFYDVDFVHEEFLWHWHNEFEIGIVEEGELLIFIGSDQHRLKSGDAYFVNSGILHAGHSIDQLPCRVHLLVFHAMLVGGSSDSVFWQDYIRPLTEDPSMQGLCFFSDVPSQKPAIAAILDAWRSYEDHTPGYPFKVRNSLSDLLLLICKNADNPHEIPTIRYLRSNHRVQTMMEFIANHYSDPITLKDIAASAAISPSECLRCFRRIIHTTPIQYLQDYRIKQAAGYLKTSTSLISEIARQCGFMEMSYFSRVFRKKYGRSPQEFRKEYQLP